MTNTLNDTNIVAQLAQQIRERGYTVFTAPFPPEPGGILNGQTDPLEHTVQLRPGLDPAQKEEVIGHELAHIVLDHFNRQFVDDLPGGEQQAEIEAEATIGIVLNQLGRHNPVPARYLFQWANGDPRYVEAILPRAHAAAKEILQGFNR